VPDLKINITATGGASASGDLKKLASATAEVAASTKSAGGAMKETAGLAEQLGRRGSSAKDVYEGLSATLNGGTGAVFGLAKAWANLNAAMRANPLGALIAVALALGPALFALVRGLKGTAASATEAGDATKTAGEQFAAAADQGKKLGDTELSSLRDQLAAINGEAEGVLALFEKINAAKNLLDDARQAVDLAKVAADTTLTPEQKKVSEFEIRQRFTGRRNARDDAARAEAVAVADDRASGLEAVAAGAAGARDTQAGRIAAVQADAAARPGRIADLRRDRTAAFDQAKAETRTQIGGSSNFYYKNLGGNPAFLRAGAIGGQIDREQAREEAGQSPGAQRDFGAQLGLLKALDAAAKEAAKSAAEARAQFSRLSANSSLDDANLPAVRALRTQAARIGAGVPEPATAISTRPAENAPTENYRSPGIDIGGRAFAPVSEGLSRGLEVSARGEADLGNALTRLSSALGTRGISIQGLVQRINTIESQLKNDR